MIANRVRADVRWGRSALVLLVCAMPACRDASSGPEPPLPDGDYSFTHRFEEHPDIPSIQVSVRIRGREIVVVNNDRTDVFPAGLLENGTLLWHARSAQWIIGANATDADAPQVGGCSAGPSVVDLERRIYWTC
jgi:hypothetical protein